jgi:two-component system sensor histidine kinase AlgZ
VSVGTQGQRVRIAIANPVHAHVHSHGNHMALANIKERLMLFYDLEADLSVREQDGWYTVAVELPLRRQGAA